MPTCIIIRPVFVFDVQGVPYALPPISQRRWKQPVPYSASCSDDAEPFEYIYTQSFGNACMQLGRDGVRPEGSEDCLFLNVWTPTLASDADLHVMVYFHGGGLIAGSGNGNGETNKLPLAVTPSPFLYQLSVPSGDRVYFHNAMQLYLIYNTFVEPGGALVESMTFSALSFGLGCVTALYKSSYCYYYYFNRRSWVQLTL